MQVRSSLFSFDSKDSVYTMLKSIKRALLQITNLFNSWLTYPPDIINDFPELQKNYNKCQADLPVSKSANEIMKKKIPMAYHKNATRFAFGLGLGLGWKSPLFDIRMSNTHAAIHKLTAIAR